MGVTLEDVKKIAELARLKVAENEFEKYRKHLNEILDYVDKLNEIDTERIAPTYTVQPFRNPLREDQVTASLPVDQVMKNAPGHLRGFFRVPKVIETQ